jgi:hypothetical protein
MDQQAAIRRVRIAASVFFGVLTVALCVLWVRSHYRGDTVVFGISDHRGFVVDSSSGILFVNYLHYFGSETSTPKVMLSKWWVGSAPPGEFLTAWVNEVGGTTYVKFPHLLLALTSGTLAAACWLRLRFSLRATLTATTLVAVVLGLVVWLGR